MENVPHRQTSSRRDGLRALVELASEDVDGEPERFVLPNGPREAAALAGLSAVREDRPAASAGRLLPPSAVVIAAFAVVAWSFGPAVGAWAAVLVAIWWAAARALLGALAGSAAAAGARGRSLVLARADSKRIACSAACAFVELLRAGDRDADAAFGKYHETLMSLARFELAAGQAAAAGRELARLLPHDPLRSVAGQMAQDKAARAVAHRAAARAATDELQAALRSRRESVLAARPPESA